jgi:hypothetical protein
MSATRDKSQKIAFVYSNLYKIYRNGKEAVKAADALAPASAQQAAEPVASEPVASSSNVLKTGALHDPVFGAVKVRAYSPVELIGKRVAKPAVISSAAGNPAIDSLKQNLQKLNELHSRLRFMLEELEDLVRE